MRLSILIALLAILAAVNFAPKSNEQRPYVQQRFTLFTDWQASGQPADNYIWQQK
jgi:hypothetical protein